MLCEKLQENTLFQVPVQQNCYFSLYNIALDTQSNEALLYFVQNEKQTLITELSRSNGGIKSINLSLDFYNCRNVKLRVYKGSLHIIGGYRKYNNNEQITCKIYQTEQQKIITEQTKQNQLQQHQNQIENQQQKPLRRSSRSRAPTKAIDEKTAKKAARREKQDLKSMAKFFECNIQDEDEEDSDESFHEQNEKDDQDQDDSSQSNQDNKQSQDQKINQMQQQKLKGGYGRKIKPSSLKYNKQTQTKESDDNLDNGQQKSKNHKQQSENKSQREEKSMNFSVPTRNPYV